MRYDDLRPGQVVRYGKHTVFQLDRVVYSVDDQILLVFIVLLDVDPDVQYDIGTVFTWNVNKTSWNREFEVIE